MNIRDALLEVHSKARAAEIADYVGATLRVLMS